MLGLLDDLLLAHGLVLVFVQVEHVHLCATLSDQRPVVAQDPSGGERLGAPAQRSHSVMLSRCSRGLYIDRTLPSAVAAAKTVAEYGDQQTSPTALPMSKVINAFDDSWSHTFWPSTVGTAPTGRETPAATGQCPSRQTDGPIDPIDPIDPTNSTHSSIDPIPPARPSPGRSHTLTLQSAEDEMKMPA